MAELRISAHPKSLAGVLKNVVAAMSEPSASSKPGPVPYVRLEVYAPVGPVEGELTAMGVGRYVVGMDSLEIEGEDSGAYAGIRVLGKNPEKTDVVDDLYKLAMAIQRTSTAKDARVHLVVKDRESIAAYYGEEFLGELGEMDPEGDLEGDEEFAGFYENYLDMLEQTTKAPETTRRLMFNLDLINRLKDIKTDGPSIVDYKVNPESLAVAIAIGPTFRALYVGIERDGFADGGPWRNGPGSPECLID
jgi:hypothetical protein